MGNIPMAFWLVGSLVNKTMMWHVQRVTHPLVYFIISLYTIKSNLLVAKS
jgi:hypothetical protein